MVAGASVGCVPAAQLKTTLAIKHQYSQCHSKGDGVCLVQTESYNTWFLHGRVIVQKICNSSQKKNPNSGGSHLSMFSSSSFFKIYFITKIK